MRQTFWELAEISGVYRKFESLKMEKADIGVIIGTELFIAGCHKIDPDLAVEQAWSLIVGYNNPILKNENRIDIVFRLRILFPELRNKKILLRRLEYYQSMGRDYRMYEWKGQGSAERIIPKFITDRYRFYERLLEAPIPRKINRLPYADGQLFRYSRVIRGGESLEFSGIIPMKLLENTCNELPDYRVKKQLKLQLPYNEINWAQQMDQMDSMFSSAWTRRAETVSLEHAKSGVFELCYKGNLHIAGGLSAGKSTFMMLETYRLVKQEGAKVGFIEGSVPQVLKRVKQLRSVGIHAVPVIGRTAREKHQQDYLLANRSNIREISDWRSDEYDSLAHLSPVCIIKALARDYERNTQYPCLQLKQDNKTVKCPLAHLCGVYRDLSALHEAEVWVATSSSVLKTRIPSMIDPMERTIYEAMYDLLDVVFADEADQVQKQFDEAFLTEYNVFGAADDIFEQLRYESYQRTRGNYGQYAGDPIINEWNDRLLKLEQMIWRIYTKLEQSQTLRRNIKNNLIRVASLAGEVAEKLSHATMQQTAIFKQLMTYASDPYKDALLADIADQLVDTESATEKANLLEQLISKVKGFPKPRVKKELLNAQLEFFMYLCRAEENIKYVLTAFPVVHPKLGFSIDFSPLFTMQRDYQAFMKEAMTGLTLGYKYDLPDGEKTGKFKLIEYTAIGRLLLHEWSNLYQKSDGRDGPAVVFLSGTSHSPRSAHYDLYTRSEWLLKANRPSSILDIFYKPVLDMSSGQLYNISGNHNEDLRREHLHAMVEQLKASIEFELMQWRESGQTRRVLLVVNSYEDVDTVRAAFRHDANWIGRYKSLSRDVNMAEDQYSRVLIESFYRERAEVLIVPLLSVGRGYNILDQQGGALFGSIFFLVRPYPMPNDIQYLVQILHANLSEYLRRITSQKLHYDKAVNKLRQISSGKLEAMYLKPDYWSLLSDKEREIMGWYTFVPVWQMIGRLLRGGKNARVFFCDAKFDAKPVGKTNGKSMIEVWASIMQINRKDPIFQSLYGPFIEAIDKMKGEISDEDDGAFCVGS